MPRLFLIILGALLVLSSVPAVQSVAQPRPGAQLPGGPTSQDKPAPALPGPGDEIPDWQAWLELARLQSYVEQFDDSLASYNQVLRVRPDHVQARLERAKVLTWAGRQDEAWKELESIPESALDDETWLILADLYAARQDYAAATRIYEVHLERKPGDDQVRLKLAEVLSWAGHYPASLEQYELLLKKVPQDVQLRRKYAFVLSWAGRHQDAIQELRRALE